MRSCAKNSDCRADYVCLDMSLRNAWGALVLDRNGSGKVCALPPPPDPVGVSDVCSLTRPAMIVPVTDAGSDADGSAP
jgi:hypothetical protein